MKNTRYALCLFISAIFIQFQVTTAEAQESSQNYFAVQYLKVSPQQESEYLRLELEVWRKMQEARIKADVLDGWYFLRIVAPIGSNTEYNYVTINVYDSPEKLAGHFENFGVDYNTILSAEEISLALRTEEIRELVYEEVWTTVEEIFPTNPEKMYRFQVFNSMKMRLGTDETEYQRMERDYWMPMHKERMKRGDMFGWGIYTMIIPGGTERNYHWATVDFYDSFIDYLRGNGNLMEEIHGRENAKKYEEETVTKRDLLKAEVRELIDYVNEGTVQSQ